MQSPRRGRRSAGLLMFRWQRGVLEVFLVHPGGPFWAHRDQGAWSIPKGEYADDEDPLQAAQREAREETGFVPRGPFLPLTPIGRFAASEEVSSVIVFLCSNGSSFMTGADVSIDGGMVAI